MPVVPPFVLFDATKAPRMVNAVLTVKSMLATLVSVARPTVTPLMTSVSIVIVGVQIGLVASLYVVTSVQPLCDASEKVQPARAPNATRVEALLADAPVERAPVKIVRVLVLVRLGRTGPHGPPRRR